MIYIYIIIIIYIYIYIYIYYYIIMNTLYKIQYLIIVLTDIKKRMTTNYLLYHK